MNGLTKVFDYFIGDLSVYRNSVQFTQEKPTSGEPFLAAGYTTRHVLDIILGLAQKVMSNYVNHLAKAPKRFRQPPKPLRLFLKSRPPFPSCRRNAPVKGEFYDSQDPQRSNHHLRRHAAAGSRMATLTNSAPEASKATLDNAGLSPYFERQFSVNTVKRYKPSRETYDQVATEFGVEAGMLRLVAAHTWDTLGAMAAGYKAALVTRPGNAALLVGAQPDIVEPDLLTVADKIILLDHPSGDDR